MTSDAEKLRVLIVDDHEAIRTSLRMILEDRPDMMVAGEAATGGEAIEACRTESYDVVLLDVRLPDIMGPEVARILRADGFSARIIGLSMRDEAFVRQQMASAGADAFVSKAAGIDYLIDTIITVARSDEK